MDETFDQIESLRPTRTLAILAAVAGGVTLLLGALGIYGVISYAVARRSREISVRAVDAVDPLSLAAALVLLSGVAYLAAWVPARRASAADPARIMREE